MFLLRSIEELQQQNQKLLEVTRDLSEKLEERETAVTDERTTELQNQLDGARKELELMKESRERQAEMVSDLVSASSSGDLHRLVQIRIPIRVILEEGRATCILLLV